MAPKKKLGKAGCGHTRNKTQGKGLQHPRSKARAKLLKRRLWPRQRRSSAQAKGQPRRSAAQAQPKAKARPKAKAKSKTEDYYRNSTFVGPKGGHWVRVAWTEHWVRTMGPEGPTWTSQLANVQQQDYYRVASSSDSVMTGWTEHWAPL